MRKILRAASALATFTWKSARAALVALGLGVVFAGGARGLADAGIPDVWLWAWGIASFLAFAGGLSFWAVSASKRWGCTAVQEPADNEDVGEPAPLVPSAAVPPGMGFEPRG